MRSDTGAISASVSIVGAARDASLGEVGWSKETRFPANHEDWSFK
jgi:hypothetical protein